MIPAWLHVLSIASLGVAVLIALVIVIDEVRHPQRMSIMNVVWPATALYGSLVALAGYWRYGRPGRGKAPHAITVAKATTHCGSGCTLGDILAEGLAYVLPVVALWFGWKTLFSEKMFAVWIVDFVFAFLIGIVFQYFTIAPMRGLGLRDGLTAALKADTLSLIAWQVGMYGFMAVAQFLLFRGLLGTPLQVASPEFWFMMQIAMLFGFVTSYPVNWWLLSAGIKEAM
jgi:hypothetical protein